MIPLLSRATKTMKKLQKTKSIPEETKLLLLSYDLYFFKFDKPGEPDYILTDAIKEYLGWKYGAKIQYTKDDVLVIWKDYRISVKRDIMAKLLA